MGDNAVLEADISLGELGCDKERKGLAPQLEVPRESSQKVLDNGFGCSIALGFEEY